MWFSLRLDFTTCKRIIAGLALIERFKKGTITKYSDTTRTSTDTG